MEYAGAFYHVICRGNQRQMIFRSGANREYYSERLEGYRQRYAVEIYTYVRLRRDFIDHRLLYSAYAADRHRNR